LRNLKQEARSGERGSHLDPRFTQFLKKTAPTRIPDEGCITKEVCVESTSEIYLVDTFETQYLSCLVG
jgi:hypothetical protein